MIKYIFAVLLIFAVNSAFSQNFNFFQREPKRNPYGAPHIQELGIQPHAATVTATDSLFNVVRPVVIPAAYSYSASGSGANAGFGVFLQHQDYNYGTQLYTVKWEVGIAGFGGVNEPAPNTLEGIATISVMGGTPIQGVPLLGGPGYIINAPKGQHWCAEVSVAIHLNN